jgi:hypothetical protein
VGALSPSSAFPVAKCTELNTHDSHTGRKAIPQIAPPPNAPYLPTQLQIQRILAKHQTVTERNVTQHYLNHTRRPVSIRTCYAIDLEIDFQEILQAGRGDFWAGLILDNESLYGYYG